MNTRTVRSFTPARALALRAILAGSIAALLAGPSAQATSGTWLNTGATNGNWNTSTNWVSGVIPGSTATITGTNANADIATFNTAVGTYGTSGNPILIDSASENIAGITFTGSSIGSYFIGTTGGNSLYLSSGGSIVMGGNGVVALTINAPLVIEGASGTYTLQNDWNNGSSLMTVNGQISGGNAGATTLTLTGTQSGSTFNAVNGNVIDGSATSLAINKSGIGTWILAGANTYTGGTTVSQGTLYAQDGASATPGANNFIKGLGTGTVALNGGTLSLRANGSGSTQTIITGDGTTGNNVTVGGNATINVDRLTANGGSTIRFNNLSIGAQTLGVTGGSTYGLQFFGTTSITGAATFNPTTAPLSLSAMTIDNTVGTGTTTTVTLGGTATNTVTGIISNNGTDATKALALTKSNTSTWTLSAANTYTGATNVTGGTLTIGGAVGSSISNSSSVSLTGGTAVVLDYTTVGDAATNKINDSATVTISAVGSPNASGNSGLQLLGNAAVNTNETIGTLAFGAGASIVGVTQANASRVTSLTATNGLTRSNFGTALLRGSSLGGQATQVGQIILGNLTGLVQVGTSTSTTGAAGTTKDLTIVPYLIGDTSASGLGSAGSGSFVTYDTFGRGFRVLATGEQNALTLTTDTFANTNVSYSPTVANSVLTLDNTNRTWNSLQIGRSSTNVSRTLTGGGGTLAITSGALQTGDQTASDATIINGFSKITFGNNATVSNLANEAVIFVNGSSGGAAAPLTIGSPIDVTQGGGLTKAGVGTLNLTAANLYTGVTTINQGTINVGGGTAAGDLGSSSGVTLNGASALTFNRTNTYSYSTGTITGGGSAAGNTVTQAGTGALTLGNVTNVQSLTHSAGTGTLTTGTITGIGTLTDSNTTGTTVAPSTTINQSGTGLTIGTISGANGSVVNFAGDGTGSTTITNLLNTAGQTVSVSAGTVNLGSSRNTADNLIVSGGTLNTTGTNRLSMANNDSQTLTISSGTLNVLATADFGERFGGDSGAVGAGFSFTGTQSGGTFNALGVNGFTLGSITASKTASYSLSGTGILNVGSSANAQGLVLGADAASTGTSTFNLSGGKLLVSGTISGSQGAGAKQAFVFTGGTLAAGTYNATNLTSTAGTAVSGSTNTLTNAGGILAPGDIGTAGRTTITGNANGPANYSITSASAVLAIDLGGTSAATTFQGTAAQYDNLSVTGATTLGGRLNFNLTNSYTPLAATNHNIIVGTTAGATGTFTNQVVATSGNSRVAGADGLSSFLIATNTTASTASVGGLTSVTARTTALGGYQAGNTYSGTGTAWDTTNAGAWTNFDPGATATPATQASGAIAQFADGTTSTGAIGVSLNSTRNIQGIQFSSAAGSRAYTISQGGSGAIMLDNTGNSASATIADTSTNGTANAINVPITLASNLAVSVTNAANTLTLGGAIGETLVGSTLTKSGLGTLALTTANTYTGATTVSGGTLLVSGSISGSTATVQNGATLGGSGNGTTTGLVGAVNVESGGTLAPGAGPGLLSTGNLALQSGSTLALELNSNTPATGYDQVKVSGTVSLTGSNLGLSLGYAPAQGDVFYLILNNDIDAITGTFAGLAQGGSVFAGGYEFQVNYFADSALGGLSGFASVSGNDVALLAIPEPGSVVSLLGGLGMLVGLRRLRRRSSS